MNIFARASASIQARFIQPWQQKYFEKTKYGKQLKQYMGKHAGHRCFFIGNGPSLRAEDLTRLQEAGEITFAFNRIYNIFDQTKWRPTYYVSVDEKMLQGCAETVDQLDLSVKFIPINMRWYHGLHIHDAVEFLMKAPQERNGEPLAFSRDIAKEIYQSGTCMYAAAQIAAYMGFSEIYLIGVDHHFHISQNNQGEIVVDNAVKDYFSENYHEDKENLYIPNTEKSTLTYIAMKKHCDQRGIKVWNATRGGKLEVFPRVAFDRIFLND